MGTSVETIHLPDHASTLRDKVGQLHEICLFPSECNAGLSPILFSTRSSLSTTRTNSSPSERLLASFRGSLYLCLSQLFRYIYKFASFVGLFSAVSMPIVATKYLFSQRVPRFTRCEFVRIAKCSKYVIFQMVSLFPRNVGSVCKYAYLISFAIFLSKVDEIISDFHNFFKTEFQRLLRKSTK